MVVWLVVVGLLGVLVGVALSLLVQRLVLLRKWAEETGKTVPHLDVADEPLIHSDELLRVDLPQPLVDQLSSGNHPAPPPDASTPADQAPTAGEPPADTRAEGTETEPAADETLLAINLLTQFFFREVQNHGPVRRFLLQRINKEMNEGLEKGGATVNKIIKELKIFDIEMGSKAPTLKRIDVEDVSLDEENRLVDSVDAAVHLEYSGGFAIGLDVAFAYEKTAQLTAKINRLEGVLHVKFARLPYSHFMVAFCPPPRMEVVIHSRIQGQSYGTLTELVASLVENWITRQHSLPNAIMMTHPIFPDPDRDLLKPTPAPTSVPTRRGTLRVTVSRISRLDPALLNADGLFCILALDSCPWVDFSPSGSVGHVMLDVRMIRKRDRPLGFVFHGAQSATEANYSLMGDIMGGLVGGQASGVVVVNTEPGSVADEAGFRPGDVILQVDGAPVNSIRQFVRAVTSTKAQYVIVRVDRFIPAIKSKVEEIADSRMPIIHRDDPRALYPLPDDLYSSHRETIARMVGLDIKRTDTYQLGKVVELGETLEFTVKPGQRFLNLSVWLSGVRGGELESTASTGTGSDAVAAAAAPTPTSPPKFSLSRLFRLVRDGNTEDETEESEGADENWTKEARIGYVNVGLAEIEADCQLNTQGRHVSTYQLYPADFTASLGRKNPLNDRPGFDPRLCYGDVVLSFVYQPDKAEEERLAAEEAIPSQELIETAERHRSPVDVVIYELKRPHDWFPTKFSHLEECDSCQSKIWMGDGLQCRRCGLIMHKKCFKRGPSAEKKWCSVNQSIAKIDDFFISNVPATPAEGVKSDLAGHPFEMDADNDEDMEIEAVVERLQARDHNESLVRLAKDTGRKVFSNLDHEKRRIKVLSLLNKLEEAVRAETVRRYELASDCEKATGPGAGPGQSKWIELELAASERKRQALILLMLHLSVAAQEVDDGEPS